MKKNIFKNEKGFSIVELIVILSIFGIMSTVSMLNYSDHYKAIEQSNLAQSIALIIRQAQVYGISASSGNIGGETFDTQEGVAESFFDTGIIDITQNKSVRGTSINLDTNTITLFEDYNIPANFVFHDGSGGGVADGVIDKRSITSNSVTFEYADLCNTNGSCVKQTTGFVDIAFQRPYPDAVIKYRANMTLSGINFTSVILVLSLKDGAEKNMYIEVSSIGNISVKSNYPNV